MLKIVWITKNNVSHIDFRKRSKPSVVEIIMSAIDSAISIPFGKFELLAAASEESNDDIKGFICLWLLDHILIKDGDLGRFIALSG